MLNEKQTFESTTKKKNPAQSKSKVLSDSREQKINNFSNLNSSMGSQTTNHQETFFKRKPPNTSFHYATNVIDSFPSTKHKSDTNQRVENVRKIINSQIFKTSHNLVNL